MAVTALSTPDPDDESGIANAEAFQAELDRVLPGAKLVMPNLKGRPSGQIDVTACVENEEYWNGRLDGDEWGYDVPGRVPPKPEGYDTWRAQVRNKIRKEKIRVKGIPNRVKALPSHAKEYLRFRIHDYLIGWVLDVNVDPWSWKDFRTDKQRAQDDVFLQL